jgi:hypothetical protein
VPYIESGIPEGRAAFSVHQSHDKYKRNPLSALCNIAAHGLVIDIVRTFFLFTH